MSAEAVAPPAAVRVTPKSDIDPVPLLEMQALVVVLLICAWIALRRLEFRTTAALAVVFCVITVLYRTTTLLPVLLEFSTSAETVYEVMLEC